MSDAARTLFLVCYDICNPKRLYRVHKYLLGYRVGGQKSFFECWLTAAIPLEKSIRKAWARPCRPPTITAQKAAHKIAGW